MLAEEYAEKFAEQRNDKHPGLTQLWRACGIRAVCVMLQANDIFARMLALDSLEKATARDVTKSKRLKKAEALLKSFFGNSLHLLGKTPCELHSGKFA